MSDPTPLKRVFFHTLGCQMNQYDTGKMRALLSGDGYTPTDDADVADLIIVNTCSIREKSVEKMNSVLGEYRRAKRFRPLTLGVAGCVAQERGEQMLAKYPEIDLVFGPDGVPHVRELVREAVAGRRVRDTSFLDLEDYPFVSEIDPTQTGTSALVTIQKGCDNQCTFCIVPQTRGVEVSRPWEQIVEEVRSLVARGAREITLIGQNVNSYGLKIGGGVPFSQLLYRVAEVPGVEQLRFTTSHPRDMGADVVQAYRDLPQLASHLHLPVQSGSNRVLRRMKRYYTRSRYLEVVGELLDARPNLVFTTDVIVGFPGESDDDFEETMSLLEEVRFIGTFSFKYSPRPGTPALKLEARDAVPEAIAAQRLLRYQDRQRAMSLAWHRSLEGVTRTVLVLGWSAHDEGVVMGRTSDFAAVNFPGDASLFGRTLPVRITRGFTHSARGEAVA